MLNATVTVTSIRARGGLSRLAGYLCLTVTVLMLGACGSDTLLVEDNQQPDPVVVDIPIVYIKRTLPLTEQGEVIPRDLRRPYAFVPGASLFIKARASASAPEVNLSDRAFFSDEEIQQASEDNPLPGYDVKDLSVSYDGEKLVFAMRAPEIEGADDDEQPTWNIWQYDRLTDSLNRVIASDIVAEAGQDTHPVYLPDGRIVFSSTRQVGNQALLLDEGKPQYQGLEESLGQPASVLHVMNDDGSRIEQISFNQSHDVDPTVLSNGKVLFSRWDQAAGSKGIHLYQMNADGSSLELVYGRHSHTSSRSPGDIHFIKSRELPDQRVLMAVSNLLNSRLGDGYVAVDIASFIDNDQPVAEREGMAGPAQQSLLFDDVRIDGSISPAGQFADVYPLWDGSERVLFSWSQCRVYDPEQVVEEGETRTILPCSETLLENPDIESAPLLYGLWMYDPQENTQLALGVPEEGIMHAEIAAMQSRAYPADSQLADVYDADLAQQNLARVHIRSVYDFAGTDTSPQGISVLADPSQTPALQRPVQFLRLVKAVSIPDRDVRDFDSSAFGRSRSQLMREIIGYVPVEPDGSVLFDIPAGLPLAFSLVDGNGRRLGARHNNWLQFGAGEVRTCNGCHSADNRLPHGRSAAEYPSINPGAATTGQPFPNTDPALFADLGETMAEVAGRINGVRQPEPDIHFVDIWSDPALTVPAQPYSFAYGDLSTPLPLSTNCAQQWGPLCRIEINYPDVIQPMFDLPRQVMDEEGLNVLEDHTCISCHSPQDAEGLAQVPAAQLDLENRPSTDEPDHLVSYRELMFGDNEQEIIEGVLLDRLVEVLDANGDPVFETDEDGELILDADGNPIPVLTTVRVGNVLSANGANSSNGFFSLFAAGGSHNGWLSGAELKLISEWLDIGGQYYNNPFAAPAD